MKKTIAVLSLLCIIGCSDGRPELHLYSWSDYISPDVISAFESEYGCRVVIDSFDSNESAYAKLKAGVSGYDVVVPSSYQIDMMAKEGMLEPLDRSKIQNVITGFDHSYDSQILDPSFKYSVPYVVTYTGVLYLKDKVTEKDVSSWAVFGNSKFNGRISFLDDMREVIGAGLMYNGFSINSTSQSEIDKAVETVLTWKKNVRKFDAESYRTEVPNKSSWIGHGYSSDSAQVIIGDGEVEARDDVGFALPKEGFTIAFDEMVILRDSKQKELAYKFIDFVYRPENAAKNIEYVCGIMPQKDAVSGLSEEYRKVFIPSPDVMKNGQVLKSFTGQEEVIKMYNRTWDKIKAVK